MTILFLSNSKQKYVTPFFYALRFISNYQLYLVAFCEIMQFVFFYQFKESHFVGLLYRGKPGKIMMKCFPEQSMSNKPLLTRHVLSGLAASLVFVSQINPVSRFNLSQCYYRMLELNVYVQTHSILLQQFNQKISIFL